MSTRTASEFMTSCEKQILGIPDDVMEQYKQCEVVWMDKVTAVDEWGEDLDSSCQMCGKPCEEFPVKVALDILAGVNPLSLPDTAAYTMVHPDSGTRFQWTVCPLCMKKLRLNGVREEVAA